MEDKLKQLYNVVGQEYALGTYDEFKTRLQDEESRKQFYNIVGQEYDLGDYDSFTSNITTPTAPSADEIAEEMQPQGAEAKQSRKTSLFGPPPAPKKAQVEDSLPQYDEVAREQMRQHLEESGTIERMEEMEKEARKAKRKERRQAGLMAMAAAESFAAGAPSTSVFSDLTQEHAKEWSQNKAMEQTLDVALDKARAGEWGGLGEDNVGNEVADFGLGLWDSVMRMSTWDFGVSDTLNGLTIAQVVKKWEENPDSLTATERNLLDAMGMATAVQEAYQDQVGIGYAVGESLPQSAGFMASMYFNPASGLGKAAARQAVKKYGRQSIAKNLARIGGDIAETAIMTATTGGGRVVADALERINGQSTYEIDPETGIVMYGGQEDQKTVGEAVVKAIGSNFIENYSEALGEYFDPLLGMSRRVAAGGLRKMNLNKWADALSDVQPSQMAASVRSLREKAKFGGVFGEIMEEEAGMALNAITVGDYTFSKEEEDASKGEKQWIFDLENQLTTALSCAIMSGTITGVETIGNVRYRREMEKSVADTEKAARAAVGDEMIAQIDQASPEGMVDILRDAYMDQSLSLQQKRVLAEYATQRVRMQYYNAADAKARRQVNVAQQNTIDAYEAGRHAQLPQYYNIDQEYRSSEAAINERENAEEIWDAIRLMNNMDESERQNIMRDFSEEDQELIRNWRYNAMRWQGAINHRAEQVEDLVDEYRGQVTPYTRPDGTLTTAILGDDVVYVMNEAENGDAVVYTNDGRKIFCKMRDLEHVQQHNAEELVERFRQQTTEVVNQETEKNLSYPSEVLEPAEGVTVETLDGKQWQVAATDGENVEIVGLVFDKKSGQWIPNQGNYRKITREQFMDWQKAELDRKKANTYEQGDELVFYVNGEPIDAEITGIDPDGNYIVQISHLADGLDKSVSDVYTAEELRKLTTPSSKVSEKTTENESMPSEEIEQSVREEVANSQIEDNVTEPTDEVVESVNTALSRVPKDAKGNPLYEQTDADTAWDAIMEQTEGDAEMAQRIAEEMVADKKTALTKMQKGKPKKGATVAEKIANEKAHIAAIAQAESEVAAWEKIAQVNAIRQQKAELERAEAERVATEQRKAEEARILAEQEEQARIEREALNGVPDMVDDVPADARARGYRRVNGHKVDRQGVLPSLQGKEVGVKFANDMIADGYVAVIEAETLQPSHLQGQRNPSHFIDEAQPKERNDEASIASARKIASNIRPEEITSSVTAYTGAPTVNMRGEAIQGNSRSDALRVMWAEHPDQAEMYKQYIIDHAEEFGLNAEEIAAMQHPVLVNMLDVSDTDAINLGQYVAQDTESGGTERIKAKNVARKMGKDIRSFANILLNSSEEEMSFAELVDKNGVEVLKWMNTKGYITPTQYASAFDSKGNLTAEAKNDLRGILYQSIFQGGNTQLEEQFNALPAKAQKAILATAYRDYDSPNTERMVGEIQSSIRAFYALSHDKDFVNAKNYKEAKEAMLVWSRQYQMDDVTGESFLPSENFSNFALELAVRYKGNTQSATQNLFNELFDLIQGTKEASLFEEADNRPRTLAEAIKETLNIDYNGQNGSNALVGDDTSSQEGRQGSGRESTSGELSQMDESSTVDRGRTAGDSNTRTEETGEVAPIVESSSEYILEESENNYINISTISQLKNLQRLMKAEIALINSAEARGELTEELIRRRQKATSWLRAVNDSLSNKEKIKSKNKWGVKSGNHPVPLDTVKAMFAEWNEDADIQALFDRVFETFSKLGINITFEDNIGSGTSQGWFSISENRAKLPMHLIYSDKYGGQKKASIMLHEMIHGVTQYVLAAAEMTEEARSKRGIILSEGMIEAAKQLNDIYSIIKKDKRFKGQYGLTDVHEMVSELAEPDFRSLLKETSIWQQIVDALKKLLGIDIDNNALEGVSRALDYILDNYDESLYNKFSSRKKSKVTANVFEMAEEAQKKRKKEKPKELIAVHNISEGNLKKVLEAGSLIMPSIAITKADMGHDNFGEISLLFDKSTINPSDRRNKVYGGDAWTPRFPRVGVKLNEKVVSRIHEKIYRLIDDRRLREIFSLSSEVYPDNIEKVISDYGVEGYYNKEWMKLAYLLDNGKKVKMPTKAKDYGIASEDIVRLAKEKGLSVKEIYEDYDFYKNNPDFVTQVKEARDEARLSSIPEEQRDEMRERMQSRPLSEAAFDSYIRGALEMERDLAHGGLEEIVDRQALRDLIEKKVKTDNAEYNKWVDNLFEGIVEKRGIRNNRDWYTPSGNLRPWGQLYDPATPANILKYMLAENEQGGSGGLFDSNIMGASAETYESIEKIREKGRQRLKELPYEEYDEWSNSVAERMAKICDDFLSPSQKNSIGGAIDAKIEITNAVAKDKTAKGIYKHMKREYPNFTMEHAKQVEEIVKEIQESATGYFEAKPQRLVSVNEVMAAVVPSNASKEIVDALKNNGIEVVTYKKGDDEARKRVVKRVSSSMDIRFRDGAPFFSNAERAVENIKQNKATPEQWLAMIKKDGGLKAGEDKWMGLSDWMNEQKEKGVKSLTKDEVLEFIRENEIEIEEVEYGDSGVMFEWADNLEGEYAESKNYPQARIYMYTNEAYYNGEPIGTFDTFDEAEDALAEKITGQKYRNSTRMDYSTSGLKNNKEIAFVVPTIESWNQSDSIHFGDAGDGRAVAWVRFGETTDEDGNRVLVIDEVQSKRHDEGRAKGYQSKEKGELLAERDRLYDKMYSDGLTEEEFNRRNEINARLEELGEGRIPDAPFDKNYHELVMKRMLRYAAENGFDKVAWTKGAQQAQRYDLVREIDELFIWDKGDGKTQVSYGYGGNTIKDSAILKNKEELENVVGKEIADEFYGEKGQNQLKKYGLYEASERLRPKTIGGEGMKGYYDEMIPRFMNKYVKKWGTKVGEVTLPEVEEAGRTMWSVDVTPEMRESVMQGQPMFREGMGAISDREVSYENDPIAKWQGKPRYYGKRASAFAERERARMQKGVEEAAKILGIEVEIINDASTLKGRKAKAKGWYDINAKKVVVVVPNHVSKGDAVRTVLHEGVAHHGLRELFGDGFDAMLDNIYNNVAPELKARIDAIAERTGVSTSVATEEYLASLAEDTEFEYANKMGWWDKIKRFFVDMLRKLSMPGLNLKEEITDNELRFLLWRSYQNLVDPNRYLKPLGYLDDVAKQKELKVGEYAENTMATPRAAEMSEAEEWSAITMQRIEELEAQMAQLDSEIAEMETDRDADDESRYDMWEEQLDVLRKQSQEIYDELEGLYSLEAEDEDIEAYEEEREAEKQRQLYQKRIDNAYLKAVREGDWEEATDLFRQYVLSKAEDEGIVPMDYGVGYRGGAHSSIAKKVKEENPDAIAEAAYQMSIRIPKGSILVPMPSRTGNATYTVKLAEAIAKATDSEVRDVLKGKARMSVYEAKQKGIKMTPEDLGMYTTEELPKGKNIVIIDNVIDKGTTALAAVSAVKGASVVAYAYTLGDKQRAATLKLAEPVTYDDNKRIIPLSQRFDKETDDIRYRLVDDQAEIDRLESEPTIKAYRAMQVINGELYPPMSAVVDGKLREPIALGRWEQSEERPELADDDGNFKLNKGNKKSPVPARYNPYFHSSATPLNDQFAEAQDRPNLVTVEVEIPQSEADGTSGYKAEKAKDAVGTHQWKAGAIQGRISGTRTLYLSRWDKPVRIVPDSEVAGVIAKMLEGTGIVMPSNVVTPSLRAELEKLGIPFVETTNRGKLAEGEHKGEGYGKVYGKKNTKKSKKKSEIIAEVEREAAALGVPVRIVRSVDELPDEETRKRAVDGQLKGYFDPRTGEVALYEPNTDDANDAKRTILHETVGHKGLRQLIGEERYDKAMVQLMYMLPSEVRDAVLRRAERHGWNAAIAMDEYLAEQAEIDLQPTWWGKVNAKIRAILRNLGFDVMLTDADVTYLLWRSRKKLMGDTAFDMATNAILKQAARKSAEADAWNEQAFKDAEMRDFEKGAMQRLRNRIGDAQNEYDSAMKSMAFKQRESRQDSMRSLKVFMDVVSKESGKKIADFENAYMYENAMSSANLMEMQMFRHDVYGRLLKAINELIESGAKYEEVVDYMMAKHGLERNEKMARKRAEKEAEGDAAKEAALYAKYRGEDLSGLTALTGVDNVADAESAAMQMIADFEAKHNTDLLWDETRACTQTILNISHDAGILSDEVYDELWNQYEYYIPLRGFDETTAEEVYTYVGDNKSPYNAPIKTAKGRKSKADNPIATIATMAESAIVEANRNRLKQRFLYMVERHRTELASVSSVWVEKDPITGDCVARFANIPNDATPEEAAQAQKAFEERMEQLHEQEPERYYKASEKPNIPYRVEKKANEHEHQVIVKRNGKDVVITINGDPRVAQAINGLTNAEAMEGFSKFAGKVNRFLSANFTTRNPAFVVSNFVRDGFYTNSMVWAKESPAYAWKYNQNWVKATKMLPSLVSKYKRYEKGDKSALDMSDPVERAFYEFMINGGETGYTVINSVEDYKGIVAGDLKTMQGGVVGNTKKAVQAVGEVLDTFGRWAEDTSRFAAFLTSREMGRSVTKSIWDAKEISVNFNKKGSGRKMTQHDKGLNSILGWMSQQGRNLYVFWNAGMQGLYNFGKAVKEHPGKMAGLTGVYFGLGMAIAAIFGGHDDDEDYWNLPEYVRRNNICFRVGNKFVTLPLPIELRAIYGMGELAMSWMAGKENPKKVGMKVVQQMSQVMPIDMMAEGGGLKAFIPSWGKPIAEVYMNTDWTGMPIYRKRTPWNEYDPQWMLAFKSTSPELVAASRAINEATNKNLQSGKENKYDRGWADIEYLNNPAAWEHVVEGYLGGLATMFNQTKKSVMALWNEDLREVRNVPVVSRFVKDAGEKSEEYALREDYFNAKKVVDELRSQRGHFRKESIDPSLTEEQRKDVMESRIEMEKMANATISQWNNLENARKRLEDMVKDNPDQEVTFDGKKGNVKDAFDEVTRRMVKLTEGYQ